MGWLVLGSTLIVSGVALGLWAVLGQSKPRYRRKG